MVHVALGVDRGDGVEHLGHAGHAERGDVEHLGLAPLEQGRAVRRREEVDLGRQRADVGRAPAVDPQAVLDDALAHQLLGQRADGGLDLAGAALELVGQRGLDLLAGAVERGVALGLGRDQVGLGDEVGADRLDPGPHVLGVVGLGGELHRLDRPVGGDDLGHQLALQEDRLADPRLGRLEAFGQHLFGDLGRAGLVVVPRVLGPAGLHHHDGDVGVGGLVQGPAGHHQLEGGGVALLEGGVRDPGAVDAVGHPDGADGAVEGDARQHQRGRGGVDGQDVVGVDLVGAEDRPDHVDLVAEAAGERRAQRPVDEPAGQDGLVRALALPAEERAGDLAGGVGPLLDVDGQGEEVGPLPYGACGGGRGQQDGVPDAGEHGAVGQLGQLSGLERQGAVGATDGARHGNGVSHDAPRVWCLGASFGWFPVVDHLPCGSDRRLAASVPRRPDVLRYRRMPRRPMMVR